MTAFLHGYIADLDGVRKDLNRVESKQLQSQRRRNDIRGLVDRYFHEIRPRLAERAKQDQDIRAVDDVMQELLVLCHKRAVVRRYKILLASAKKRLIAVEALVIANPTKAGRGEILDSVDEQIISTLDGIDPSAALSYRQALLDLDAEQRFSWRGPATDLREALRETLDHLAPDNDVKAMPGYKDVPNTSGPTMKQKVRYIMRNRGVSRSLSETAETAVDAIENAIGSFVRAVYTRSNVSTHTPTEKSEVLRVRDFVRVVLCELLEIRP